MTPYDQGYKTTLKWLRNQQSGNRMPPPNQEQEFYQQWWHGAQDAHCYYQGWSDVVTVVEDILLQGISVSIMLSAVILTGYAMLNSVPLLGLLGCGLAAIGIYSYTKLRESIHKREDSKSREVQDEATNQA